MLFPFLSTLDCWKMFHYHRGSEQCSSSTARARKKEIMSILECNISPVLLETVYLKVLRMSSVGEQENRHDDG